VLHERSVNRRLLTRVERRESAPAIWHDARKEPGVRSCWKLVPAAWLCLACGAPDRIEGVVYDTRFGDATTMDVYLPSGAPERSPALVMIHGGAWRAGSRDAYRDAAIRMARSGWVAATINYRLGSAGVYPRAVQDCLCALSFLRAHAAEYGIDPSRVAVTGYSAGGHLASLLGVAAEASPHVPDCDAGGTEPPNAVVSSAGPQDLRGRDHEWVRDFLGGSESELPESYASASPLFHVGAGKPPLLMIAGGADWLVDDDAQLEMRDAMRAAGNDAETLLINGGGHLLNPDENIGAIDVEVADMTPEAWTAMSEFLDRTLGWP
jgi:acetyl esterase/lipase